MRYVLAFVFALWPLPGFLFRSRGTRRSGGFRKRFASTDTRALGRRTRGMDMREGFSFSLRRGVLRVVPDTPTTPHRESSSTERSSSTNVTATVGGSGEPPEPADCDE